MNKIIVVARITVPEECRGINGSEIRLADIEEVQLNRFDCNRFVLKVKCSKIVAMIIVK